MFIISQHMFKLPHFLHALADSSEERKMANLLVGVCASCWLHQENHCYSREYANPLWQHHFLNSKIGTRNILLLEPSWITPMKNVINTLKNISWNRSFARSCVLGSLFPGCGTEQLSNLIVKGSECQKKAVQDNAFKSTDMCWREF